jgi:uncharacterized membrane protein required for colicin V production
MILSIVGILMIVGLGRLGMHFGLFYELTSTLLLFFAMMVVLRYWYPATVWVAGWFGGGAGYAAFCTFWALFLIGASPLIVILNRLTESATPKYPKVLDSFLGLVFGVVSALIVVCCLMTSLSVVLPMWYTPYDRTQLMAPFDTIPIQVYQAIERDVLAIPAKDPGHTRFPTFDKANVDEIDKYWK